MRLKIFLLLFLCLSSKFWLFSQELAKKNIAVNISDVKFGAYYFDGWTGTYSYHITPLLVNSFSNREPKWGWITSSQTIMNEQIDLCKESGLSFFSFCWYYVGKEKYVKEPLNNSLYFYLNSPNRNKLEYTLLVVNQGGAAVGPNDWEIVCKEWINQFKSDLYLKVDGKPMITFFSVASLKEKFNTADNVKEALNGLRNEAIKAGLKGVSIAITLGPNKEEVELAEACGFDILTGYNYHGAGFITGKDSIPIENMQKAEINVWNQFSKISKLPYIPVTTLNWDPRPWASSTNNYKTAAYYVGFSEESVYNSVRLCKEWILKNSQNSTAEKIGLIYAWNEYGEGAYLTPTKEGTNPLKGVIKALKK